jgi:RNA polymerase sigma factor (sigma-70 family)
MPATADLAATSTGLLRAFHQLAGGDEQAWSQFIRLAQHLMRDAARRAVPDAMMVEDAVQETCITLHGLLRRGAGPTVADETQLINWLYTVAGNAARRLARTERQQQRHRSTAPGAPVADEPVTDLEPLLARLRHALGLLPARQRQILVRRYSDGWDNARIADEQGLPRAAVAVLAHRAQARLRRLVGAPFAFGLIALCGAAPATGVELAAISRPPGWWSAPARWSLAGLVAVAAGLGIWSWPTTPAPATAAPQGAAFDELFPRFRALYANGLPARGRVRLEVAGAPRSLLAAGAELARIDHRSASSIGTTPIAPDLPVTLGGEPGVMHALIPPPGWLDQGPVRIEAEYAGIGAYECSLFIGLVQPDADPGRHLPGQPPTIPGFISTAADINRVTVVLLPVGRTRDGIGLYEGWSKAPGSGSRLIYQPGAVLGLVTPAPVTLRRLMLTPLRLVD